ncbi:MAG: helix-turn-helix transcriptional regulator [Chitinispirillaceae bacterium]|nr:helix-turn-helix transcriptional regulator [Chitinispirillaceae bacterium]
MYNRLSVIWAYSFFLCVSVWGVNSPGAEDTPGEETVKVSEKDDVSPSRAGLTAAPQALTRHDSAPRGILPSKGRDHTSPDSGVAAAGVRRWLQRIEALAGSADSWIGRNPLFALVMVGVLLAVLVLWIVGARIRAAKDEKRFMTTTRLSLMDGEVQRACLHIEKHFMNPGMTPASVCSAIVTGRPFLETMFEKDLGMSIAGYIDQVRIHHVRQIITWNPAADSPFIAAHAGFPDTSALVNAFKEITGADLESFRAEKQRSSKMPS